MHAINSERQANSPAAIEEAARHAFQIGCSHLDKVSTWMRRPAAGLDVLELGPGPNFGSVLTLAAMGARVAVADRWLPQWDSAYHGPVYARLAELIEAGLPGCDTTPIRALVAAGAHLPGIVTTYPDAELLTGAPADGFDLVLSNAVFEHIVGVESAARCLYAVTRPGGTNVHQIDFRDHRDFSRPLEYLLMTPDQEAAWLRQTDYHCGTQRRAGAYVSAFRSAGFELVRAHVSLTADPAYLADFVPRLRACSGASLQDVDVAELEELSTGYVLRKPEGAAA